MPIGSLSYALAKRLLGSRQTRRFAWARWGQVRLVSASRVESVYRCRRIEWDVPGHARAIGAEIPGPSADQILIRTIASAVSPGTERAHFRVEPNAVPSFPHSPGYSLAGEVWRVGSGVKDLNPGQLVAARGLHASLVAARAEDVFPVPPGVTAEEAAYIFLGIIALNGVWRSGLRPEERVVVLGRGLVGQLTVQLAAASGAGTIASVAPSMRHVTSSLSRFADRVVVSEEKGRIALSALQADVTFEASGSPQALNDAAEATRDGGRVVLLGSPRLATRGFDFGALADRRITLLGAHVSALADAEPTDGRTLRSAGETFLKHLAKGLLDVRSLTTAEIDPAEAGRFYRNLAKREQDWVGVLLRWDKLPMDDRARRASYLALPDMDAMQGMQMEQSDFAERVVIEPWGGKARRLPVPRILRPPIGRSTLGVAIIGCGVRGTAQAVVCGQIEGASLAAVMDSDERLARGLGERLRTRWTTSYDEVLSDEAVKAVFICSPHHVHSEQAIQAARAGKHIIVEKPLAHDLEAATQMVRAARESGVWLSPWLGYRYQPEVVRAKELFERGAVGTLLGAHVVYQRKKPVHYSGQALDGSPGWRGRWVTAGGGVLIMSGIHYLDWLLHLTGLRITEVSCSYGTLDSKDEVEDALAMWAKFENGALATVDVASCVPGFYRQNFAHVECRLWGTDGHISLTPPFQFFSSRALDGKRSERWHSLEPLPRMRNRDVEYLHRFVQAVLGGQSPEITGEDGLRLQAVIEAAYRSGREGRPVSVEYADV